MGSRNAFPYPLPPYHGDGRGVNAVFARDHSVEAFVSADGQYVLGGEFCRGMALALRLVATAFFLSILRVVEVCSKKQVTWVDAGRNVAGMQNTESCGDWPSVGFPCKTMGEKARVIEERFSVTKFVRAANPDPASGLGDSFDARFDVLLRAKVAWRAQDTSNKGKGPVSRVGRAGPLSLFPVGGLYG